MNEMNESELRIEALDALNSAREMQVLNDDDYVAAGNYLKVIKERVSRITAYWKPKKEQAQTLHKSLVAAEKELLAPLEQADSAIRSSMLAYQKEQERIRAEIERERRRKEEEAARVAAEAARLAEEAGRKDELDQDDVDILRMAQADAERMQAEAAMAPVAPPAARVAGVTTRKVWKARIVDDKLVPISISGFMLRPIDMTALNRLANGGTTQIPGVEFYQEETMQVRY